MQSMADLARLGIRLEAHSDRLRYSPRSAVTPDLADRMKSHKTELMAILRPEARRTGDLKPVQCPNCGSARLVSGKLSMWCSDCESRVGPVDDDASDTNKDLSERTGPEGFVRVIHPDHADDDIEIIDLPDPCNNCGSLQLWWNVLGDPRCMKCDPPHPRAADLRRVAAQYRNRITWNVAAGNL